MLFRSIIIAIPTTMSDIAVMGIALNFSEMKSSNSAPISAAGMLDIIILSRKVILSFLRISLKIFSLKKSNIAKVVPTWKKVRINDDEEIFSISEKIRMWPLLEIGSSSVTPCTIPIINSFKDSI